MGSRRDLLGAGVLSAAIFAGPAFAGKPVRINPTEDLMEEHGLVGRVIYIYRRAIERIEAGEPLDGGHVAEAASLVSRVIHEHHEPEEERVVFPPAEKDPDLRRMTAVLRGQHEVARSLTARIGLEIADAVKQRELVVPMKKFIEMYEPHGAYENTIIYPAFRAAVGPERYEAIARTWARDGRSLAANFDDYAKRLELIDRALGLDLAQATVAVRSRS